MTARVGHALAWRPEWPYVLLVALFWMGLLGWHGAATVTSGGVHHGPGGEVPGADLAIWMVMAAAMMLPVTFPAIGHVAFNSIRARRQRAMAVYVLAFTAPWLAFGLLVLAGRSVLIAADVWNDRAMLGLTLVVAAAWQLTRAKRRALYQCQQTVPLPPLGWRADVGCARFGLLQAWRCMRSCWALMLVMASAERALLPTMLIVSGLIAFEEYTRLGRRALGVSAGGLIVLATVLVLGCPQL